MKDHFVLHGDDDVDGSYDNNSINSKDANQTLTYSLNRTFVLTYERI